MKEAQKKGECTRKEILGFIIAYMEQHGYSPSYQEIGEAVNLRSKSTIHDHISKMIERGMLETDAPEGSQRAIRVPGYKFTRADGEKEGANRE